LAEQVEHHVQEEECKACSRRLGERLGARKQELVDGYSKSGLPPPATPPFTTVVE